MKGPVGRADAARMIDGGFMDVSPYLPAGYQLR